MRFHAGSTREDPIRSIEQEFQSPSRNKPELRLRGYKDLIDANDGCLIVEDNFFIFMAIEDIVRALGFRLIDRASTVEEAREHLKDNNYRLALLDFRLGVANSSPLIKTLEKNRIPFAVTTGYAFDEVMKQTLKGAPVISKPYVDETVNRVIAELLTAQPIA